MIVFLIISSETEKTIQQYANIIKRLNKRVILICKNYSKVFLALRHDYCTYDFRLHNTNPPSSTLWGGETAKSKTSGVFVKVIMVS